MFVQSICTMFTTNCLRLRPSLSSDSPCCMWTATSVWTCRPRRTRWCPPWETATAAALSSGCSATWPWAPDPSPHLSSPLPRSVLILTRCLFPQHAVHLSSCHSPASEYNVQAASAYLPLWERLLFQLASGVTGAAPAVQATRQAGALGTSACPSRENNVSGLCMEKHSNQSTLLAVRPACSSDWRWAACQTIKQKCTQNELCQAHLCDGVRDFPCTLAPT